MFTKFVYRKKSNHSFSQLSTLEYDKRIKNIKNFLRLKCWFDIQNMENIIRLLYVAVQKFKNLTLKWTKEQMKSRKLTIFKHFKRPTDENKWFKKNWYLRWNLGFCLLFRDKISIIQIAYKGNKI